MSTTQPTTGGNPSIVREAFLGPLAPLRVGDLELHPLTLASFMLLEELGSPLVQQPTEGEPKPKVGLFDLAVAAYILTRDVDASQAVLAGVLGREKFDRAVYQFAKQIPATDMIAVGAKIRTHLNAAFATVIGTQEKNAEATGPAAATPAESNPSNTSGAPATASVGA
ncbi:hypothetical protein ASA1KI_21270 [Opitutales bacterium ASA1]|uniref:hypothetical protein n=1 Tax=Congregicoccus parvus TaxID=3081749 RepID=UPI002B28DC5F|nr:hypothetical protein ASA1KI_21270 [Opitutales bacterium ASA1]